MKSVAHPYAARAVVRAIQLVLLLQALIACGDSEAAEPFDAQMPSIEDAALDAEAKSQDAAEPGMDASNDAGPPPPAIVSEPEDKASYLFDPREVRTYELSLSAADLAKIDADPTAEEYVEGMLRFEDHDYGPVGIRYKGSFGGFRDCVASTISGAKTCTKLSMKVSFNWLDPELEFYGLRKLQFHAMNRDASMLKERLGYALFREAGIAAPRAVHARLMINGKLVGLFALVEQIDGRFTRSRFSEGGKGLLYKEAWPVSFTGGANSDAVLRPTLETNEDENPSLQAMIDFGSALEHSSGDTLDEAIATYSDVDYAMRYVAVDRAIAHDDGPMHWYCSTAGCYNHNYYWYQEEEAAKLWLVAWDLDSAFNLDNTTTTLWFDWDDTALGCRAVTKPPFLVPLRPPSCDPLILAWAQQQERFVAETRAFLDGPFDAARVASKLDAWQEQIAPFVAAASEAHDDAPTPDAWRDAAAALREAIATLRERAEDRVARGAVDITDPRIERLMDAGHEDAALLDASADDDAGE